MTEQHRVISRFFLGSITMHGKTPTVISEEEVCLVLTCGRVVEPVPEDTQSSDCGTAQYENDKKGQKKFQQSSLPTSDFVVGNTLRLDPTFCARWGLGQFALFRTVSGPMPRPILLPRTT